jgi:DNA (cytosine-5)-methyltransferase 1
VNIHNGCEERANSEDRDDGSCADCTAKSYPDTYTSCPSCGAECGHDYCKPCDDNLTHGSSERKDKPRLLDLFCGAGGAAVGYHRAGFDVGGVDLHPQPRYPFEFDQADALQYLRDLINRDLFVGPIHAIHASPPCQAYTGLNNDKSEHPKLIAPVRELLEKTGLPYVIENVDGAKNYMLDPISMEGKHFGLHIKKKRWFETNWPLPSPVETLPRGRDFLVYEHGKWRWTQNVPVYGSGGRKAVEYWPYAMGVGQSWDDCWMTRDELAQAIPPAYTEWIGRRLLSHVRQKAAA